LKFLSFLSFGRVYITGFNHLVLDRDDPFPEGFRIGDAPPDQGKAGVWV